MLTTNLPMKTRNGQKCRNGIRQQKFRWTPPPGDASFSVAAGGSPSYPASKILFFYVLDKNTSVTMQKCGSTK